MKKTTLFKKLVLDEEILILPGAYDALSAKIIEQASFKAVTLGGYPTSASLLAKPDVSLLTLTEMVNQARYIAESVDIPLFVDGDTGHGNVTNVQRTVRVFENAGVAGLFIEDQVFPKRCGHMEGKQVISTGEMIAKIKAAVDARRDDDLMIMARTDSLAVYGMDEAIERGNRFAEAGADIIFIEAPSSIDDMRRVCREVKAPMSANMVEGGKTPILTAKELQEIGYSIVTFPLSTLYAAAWGVRRVMEELAKKGTTTGIMDKMITFSDFNQLVGLEEVRAIERHYYKELFELTKK
ncbi:MAG: oxaloacetate decarboxylase [Syntrophaceae bacterium]|nr:oxaloacetate decarboxylase [Syntrophaceae bacterium]